MGRICKMGVMCKGVAVMTTLYTILELHKNSIFFNEINSVCVCRVFSFQVDGSNVFQNRLFSLHIQP